MERSTRRLDGISYKNDENILHVDKRDLPGQSHKSYRQLNVIKPNLREGYGIMFENIHRSESGLSEISINIDKETFEKVVNYKSGNDDEKANSINNAKGSNIKSENQVRPD